MLTKTQIIMLVFTTLELEIGFSEKCCDEAEDFYFDSQLISTEKVIPEKYGKKQSPKMRGEATEVDITLYVERIINIDEATMTFTCGGYLVLDWLDQRLNYPQNITANKLPLPAEWLDELWKPDLIIRNLKEIGFFTMPTEVPYHTLWITRRGKVRYIVGVHMVLFCPMNFHKYPHDEQTCRITFNSFEHAKSDMIIKWSRIGLTIFNITELQDGLSQLEMVSYHSEYCSYGHVHDELNCLDAVFVFKRHFSHILFHIYIPTTIIVMVSWLSFWLSYEDVTERVMLGITSLLTIFAQHSISGELIPPVSYLTAVDIFMLMCTGFVFLSILEFSMVYLLARDYIKKGSQEKFPNGNIKDANYNPVPCQATQNMELALKLDKICRYAGPGSFILVNSLYWIVYVFIV